MQNLVKALELRTGESLEPFMKAKYTKRWKGKDGKWRYEYARPGSSGRSKQAEEAAGKQSKATPSHIPFSVAEANNISRYVEGTTAVGKKGMYIMNEQMAGNSALLVQKRKDGYYTKTVKLPYDLGVDEAGNVVENEWTDKFFDLQNDIKGLGQFLDKELRPTDSGFKKEPDQKDFQEEWLAVEYE